jgi:hypothetical protein
MDRIASKQQRMPRTICQTRIEDQSTWSRLNFDNDDSWIVVLTADDIEELRQAVRFLHNTKDGQFNLTRQDFPLEGLASKLAACLDQVLYGRGFVLLRGLPCAEFSDEDAGILFRGMGTYLGEVASQNAKGDLLGHVRDAGYADYRGRNDIRGYQTRANLEFHTDVVDIVGLMCLRPAKEGGESLIVSSTTIHNALLETSAAHLGLLYGNFLFDRRGEEGLGEPPYFVSPLYSLYDGALSCRPGVIDYIFSAEERLEFG